MKPISLTDLQITLHLFTKTTQQSGENQRKLASLGRAGVGLDYEIIGRGIWDVAWVVDERPSAFSVDLEGPSLAPLANSPNPALPFCRAYNLVAKLKARGMLSRPGKEDIVSLADAEGLIFDNLPDKVAHHVRKKAAIETYRLFDDPVADARLRELVADYLQGNYQISRRELAGLTKKPTLMVHEDDLRRAGATLTMASDPRLPHDLLWMLLERVGEAAGLDTLDVLADLARRSIDNPQALTRPILKAVGSAGNQIVYQTTITRALTTMGVEVHDVARGLYQTRQAHNDLSGVDTKLWNPETDQRIEHNYSLKDLEGKYKNKEWLHERFQLPYVPFTPLIGVTSPFGESSKDILTLMKNALTARKDVRFIVSGVGDNRVRQDFLALAKAYPRHVVVVEPYSPSLAAQIYASSDLLLVSRSENWGEKHARALHYGAIPVVPSEADSIEDSDTIAARERAAIYRRLINQKSSPS